MRHPEVDDMPAGASFYGYQPGQGYVAVGQPMAPVAPVGFPQPQQAPAPKATPEWGGMFMVAIAAAFLGGAGLTSALDAQQPATKTAKALQQEAQHYQERVIQQEQRLTEVRNQVCPSFY